MCRKYMYKNDAVVLCERSKSEEPHLPKTDSPLFAVFVLQDFLVL